MINMLVEQIVPLPGGSELLQEATDAFSLLAKIMLTVTELNQILTYIVITCSNVPHPSQSQIICLGMIYQSR